MWWNEVVSFIRENISIVVIGALCLIVVSAAIGFIAGTRRKAQKSSRPMYQEKLARSRGGEFFEGIEEIPIPDPIIPKSTDLSGFILYDDMCFNVLVNTEIGPGKLSDLFNSRKRGLSLNVKPFIFKGEEMDILTDSEDIIEP